MSEHPELREAPDGDRFSSERLEATALIDELLAGRALQWARVDNAHNDLLREVIKQLTNRLLAPAGPVGKLQAELAEVQSRLDDCQQLHDIRMDQLDALADTERTRREAIGAWVQAHPGTNQGAIEYQICAMAAGVQAAGESAVTEEARGEVTHRSPRLGAGVTPCCGRSPFDLPGTDRMTIDEALVTCRAVTGEQARP